MLEDLFGAMPKRLREKNKVKCTAMVVDEGERLESVIKVEMSLSLMVKSK